LPIIMQHPGKVKEYFCTCEKYYTI
jgi:hypothetical protein